MLTLMFPARPVPSLRPPTQTFSISSITYLAYQTGIFSAPQATVEQLISRLVNYKCNILHQINPRFNWFQMIAFGSESGRRNNLMRSDQLKTEEDLGCSWTRCRKVVGSNPGPGKVFICDVFLFELIEYHSLCQIYKVHSSRFNVRETLNASSWVK